MRITNNMVINNFISSLNKASQNLDTVQSRASSGRKFTRASEDPMSAIAGMQARTDISKLKQYQRNCNDARNWLTLTETALTDMNSIINRVYELTVDGMSGGRTIEDRKSIAQEISQLEQQLIESANSDIGGRFIFGGYNVGSRPFEIGQSAEGQPAALYNGENIIDLGGIEKKEVLETLQAEKYSYRLGMNASIEISFPGVTVLGTGEKNLFNVIEQIRSALTGEFGQVLSGQLLTDIQEGRNNILSMVTEVGGRLNRIEFIGQQLGYDEITYTDMKSQAEDTDYAETMVRLKAAEVLYEAALSAGAKVVRPTLVDFLI